MKDRALGSLRTRILLGSRATFISAIALEEIIP